MKKSIINKVVAIAFIIGGLSISNPAKAADGDYCWVLFDQCMEGCINSYGYGAAGHWCMNWCVTYELRCQNGGALDPIPENVW